jgi:hypothetical protein
MWKKYIHVLGINLFQTLIEVVNANFIELSKMEASLGWLLKVYLDIILHYTVERIIDEDIQLALVGYWRFI